MRSAAIAIVARVCAALSNLFVLALRARLAGNEGYGLVATLTQAVAWLGLMNMGVGTGLQNLVTAAHAKQDWVAIGRFYNSGMALLGGTAFLAGLLAMSLPFLVDVRRILPVTDSVLAGQIWPIVYALVLALILMAVGSINSGVLTALQRNDLVQKIVLVSAFATAVAGGLCYLARGSVSTFVLCTSPIAGLTYVLMGRSALRRLNKAAFRLDFTSVSREVVRKIMPEAGYFFTIQICLLVLFNIDALLIAHLVSVEAVSSYSIAMRSLSQISLLFGAFLTPLWAGYALAKEQNDVAWIQRTHRKMLKFFLAAYTIFAVATLIAGRPVLAWWFGSDLAPSRELLALVLLFCIVRQWTDIYAYLVNGLGMVKQQAASAVVHAAVTAGLMLLLGRYYGVEGVAVGALGGYALVSAWFLPLLVRRWFAVRPILPPP
jgi:O-antigen/teichoic acid export membrane protein